MKALRVLLTGLSVLLPAVAAAQDFPSKPIRLIVPFPPGGPNDIIARLVGQRMSEITKQPVLIDNRGGQAGVLGTDAIAKAAPDGYTIGIVSASSLVINPTLEKVPYDVAKDFAPVTLVTTVPEMLVVASNVPAGDMKELIALAKAQPGKLNFASAGVGGLPHLAGELLKLTASIDIVHVPYRGAAPAINDLLGQQVQMAFLDLPVLLPHIKAGTLRPIALGAPKRAPTSPDVPTTAEVGMPDLLIENWYGMLAPGGTPEPIVATLNRVANEAMNDPQVKQKLADQGLTVAGNTPAQFRDYIGTETQKWARVIKAAGLATANDVGFQYVTSRRPLQPPTFQRGAHLRRCSANCCAGLGSARKLRAQITSFRLAQESLILTTLIFIDRAHRFAATSGITPIPMPAATIWPIASKLFSRARKRRRAPSRAACPLIWACSAIELISPTKSRFTTSLKSTCRRFASSSSRAATSTRRSSLNGIRSILSASACSAASPRSAAPIDDGAGDLGAFAFLDVDRNVGMRGQKGSQRLRQIFRKPRCVGEEADGGLRTMGKGGQIAAHRLDIVEHDPGVIEQAFAGRRQFDAATAARQQRNAERFLQSLDPLTPRGQREMNLCAPLVMLRVSATATKS